MAKYVVHYEMRQGSKSSVNSKTVECTDERDVPPFSVALGFGVRG